MKLSEVGADTSSILKTMEQLQIEPVQHDYEEADNHLATERDELKEQLQLLTTRMNISWAPDAGDAVRRHYASEKRHKLLMDIATLRFQIALENYLLEKARDANRKNTEHQNGL